MDVTEVTGGRDRGRLVGVTEVVGGRDRGHWWAWQRSLVDVAVMVIVGDRGTRGVVVDRIGCSLLYLTSSC